MDAALDGEWCSFYFYIMFLHLLFLLLYSCLADAPPPAHQATTMKRRQRRNTRQRKRLVRRVSSFSVFIAVFFHLHDSHVAAKRCEHEVEQGASSRTHSFSLIYVTPLPPPLLSQDTGMRECGRSADKDKGMSSRAHCTWAF